MQKPIREIENAKAFLKEMKRDLRYTQNPARRDLHIDALNSCIKLVNLFESFLEKKYKLEAVEGLLVARVYSLFYGAMVDDGQICIKRVVRMVEDDMRYGKARKQELINFLFAESAAKSVSDKEKITSEKEWKDMLDALLVHFKKQMLWS